MKDIMDNKDLIDKYNYDSFVPENFNPWNQFDQSPPVGVLAPDFPLWDLENKRTSLSEIWSQNTYSIVEFGSFT
jgi:hypothetical protein